MENEVEPERKRLLLMGMHAGNKGKIAEDAECMYAVHDARMPMHA